AVPQRGPTLFGFRFSISGFRSSDLPIYTIEIPSGDPKRERRQRGQAHRRAGRAFELNEELDVLARLQPEIGERHRPFEDVLDHAVERDRDGPRAGDDEAELAAGKNPL